MTARVLPYPRLSLLVAALWLLLNDSVEPAHLVLAAVLGVALPWYARRILPSLPVVRRPLRAVGYVLFVLRDIVVANFQVARLVLSPLHRLHPRIVVVPLDVTEPLVASLLAMTVTLTPGTVSVELDLERRRLTVHALSAADPATLIHDIKTRYEARLQEIFQC